MLDCKVYTSKQTNRSQFSKDQNNYGARSLASNTPARNIGDPVNAAMLMILLLVFMNYKAVTEKKRKRSIKVLITCLLMGSLISMVLDVFLQIYRRSVSNCKLAKCLHLPLCSVVGRIPLT